MVIASFVMCGETKRGPVTADSHRASHALSAGWFVRKRKKAAPQLIISQLRGRLDEKLPAVMIQRGLRRDWALLHLIDSTFELASDGRLSLTGFL